MIGSEKKKDSMGPLLHKILVRYQTEGYKTYQTSPTTYESRLVEGDFTLNSVTTKEVEDGVSLTFEGLPNPMIFKDYDMFVVWLDS